MDPRLLDYYNRELRYIREMGEEFAEAYPRIAARLSLRGIPCPDPYVERLLESFAFLTARVQLKLDARHPDFTQQLFEAVYPNALAPVPAAIIAEFTPDPTDTSLLAGVRIPRGSELRTLIGKGERTACQFRTAHDVDLWPLQVREARYLVGAGALAAMKLPPGTPGKAALRLRLSAPSGVSLRKLPLKTLTFHIKAPPDIAALLTEQVFARSCGAVVRGLGPTDRALVLPPSEVSQVGLDDDDALLPVPHSGFQGYRLMQEYFALPERLQFVRISGLDNAMPGVSGNEMELLLLFTEAQPALENSVDAGHIRLYATPAVNLFEREVDRIHYSTGDVEQHLVVDRNRPMDFEIHSIRRVRGIGAGGEVIGELQPLYRLSHRVAAESDRAFFTVHRRPRLYSQRQRQTGSRSQYVGTEIYLSVADARQRQHSGVLRQLDVRALCTNRDLPLQLQLGRGKTDFVLDGSAPVDSIRCLSGPTRPRPSPAFGDTSWRLISHLTLNYLSLDQGDPAAGAEMLRELLALYVSANDIAGLRQVEGVRRVAHRPVVRRVPTRGPIAYGRGIGIELELDETAFEGIGAVALGAVLDRFFARYASINSFTELTLKSTSRGDIKRWPARIGTRQLL